MKVGDKITLKDAGAATVTDIHEDTGRVEFQLPDGRKGMVWPDGIVESADAGAPAAAAGKASVTHNGKPV